MPDDGASDFSGVFVLRLLLAYHWALWDKRNQTLYSKMVNTIVVRVG